MATKKEKRTVELVMNGQQPAKTLKELNSDIRTLTASIRNMQTGSKEWTQHAQKLQDLRAEYKQVNGEIYKTANSVEYLKNQMKGVAIGVIGANLITSATQSITSYFSGAIQGIATLSDELADVQRVTGLTGDKLQYVNSQLSAMETRTSRSELRELAFIAGKLGNESVEDVLGFVSAADKINVALGEDMGGDALREIGKLTDIFKLKEEFGLEEGMLKIASAINDVGDSSTATEKYLVEFTKRMAGVSGIGKISAPQLIGLAGTLDSLGQTAEVSSTALSKMLVKMGGDVETFAKLAGKDINEFRDLLENNGLEALYAVIQRMGQEAGGLEDLAGMLGDIGLDGGRVVGVLGTLANNMDEVARQTEIATKAFDENTSILRVFEIKNETAAAKIDKLRKQISKLKESKAVKDAVHAMIDALQALVNMLIKAGQIWSQYRAVIHTVIAMILAYNAAKLKNIVITKTAIALQKSQNAGFTALALAIKAVAVAEQILTGQIKLRTIAQAALNKVTKANPLGAFLALVTAVTIGLIKGIKYLKQWQQGLRMERVKISIQVETDELDEFKKKLDELNKRSGSLTGEALKEEHANIKKTISDIRNSISKDHTIINQKQEELEKARQLGNRKLMKDLTAEIGARRKIISEKNETWNELWRMNVRNYKKITQEEQEIANEAAETREELAKEEIERLRKLNEEYKKQYDALQKARRQATVQVIEDDFQRELAQLRLNHKEKMSELRKQVEDEIQLARQLGKSKQEIAELEKLYTDLASGQEADYNRRVKEANDKKQKELAEAEYNQEMENLAKWKAGREMLINEAYQNDLNNKEHYDDLREELELEAKRTLLAILEDYGMDVTQAELDLSNAVTKITEDKIRKNLALEIAAAEERLRIAQYEVKQAQKMGMGRSQRDANIAESKAMHDLLLLQIAQELDIVELTEEKKFEIREKYAYRFHELEEALAEKEMNRRVDIAQFAFDTLQEFSDLMFSFRSQRLEEELNQLQERYDRESAMLEDHREKGHYTEKEYQERKEKLDEKQRKQERAIRRKQAIAEKSSALFNIALSTAQGIMRLWVNPGFPAAIPMAAVVGGMGAIQAGAVAARKVPTYGRGIRLQDNILRGPSHSSKYKGIHMIDPRTGQLVGLAEGGEVILSKKTAQNNAPLVDALLDSSMNKGGVSISSPQYYQSAPLPALDTAELTKQVRTTTLFRDGGRIWSDASTTEVDMDEAPNTNNTSNTELLDLFQRTTRVLERLEAHGVEAYFDYQKWEREMERQKDFKERKQQNVAT